VVNSTFNKFGKNLPPVKTGQRFGENPKKQKARETRTYTYTAKTRKNKNKHPQKR